MKYQIKEITDKNTWDSFVSKSEQKTFLHSWNWGEFNRVMGGRIFRLGVYDNSDLVGLALIIKVEARRGSFLFCPHGPILDWGKKETLEALATHLKMLAEQEKVHFIRISPLALDTPENKKLFSNLGFRDAPIHMHPEVTWTLDVTPSLDDILSGMRKGTRYDVRKAEKEGVEIIKSKEPKDIKEYFDLQKETVERHKFIPFSLDFLTKQFETFARDDEIVLFLAKYKKEIIAAAIIVYYADSGFYHHGASTLKYPKIQAPYLLQWEAIKEAKNRELLFYNFWGIAPDEDDKGHPWHGLTTFKKGFGGFRTDYLHAQDLVLKKGHYLINYLVESIRRRKRHL